MTETGTFEASFQKLEHIVRELEEGSLTLDDSLKAYEAGVSALRRCREILSKAEQRIELLTKDGDDAPGTVPAEVTDDGVQPVASVPEDEE